MPDQRSSTALKSRCRECEVTLTRENTGGYCAGAPDVCKSCEQAAWDRAWSLSLVPIEHSFPYPVEAAPWL